MCRDRYELSYILTLAVCPSMMRQIPLVTEREHTTHKREDEVRMSFWVMRLSNILEALDYLFTENLYAIVFAVFCCLGLDSTHRNAPFWYHTDFSPCLTIACKHVPKTQWNEYLHIFAETCICTCLLLPIPNLCRPEFKPLLFRCRVQSTCKLTNRAVKCFNATTCWDVNRDDDKKESLIFITWATSAVRRA